MNMDQRVVVTGVGMVTPIGSGREHFWRALLAGTSGVDEVRCFDTSKYKVHRGCEVKDFDFEERFHRSLPGGMGRASQLAVAATAMALDDAGLGESGNGLRRDRAGVSIGTTCGEIRILEHVDEMRLANGDARVPWELVPKHPAAMIPANVGHWFAFEGPNTIIPTACAAGNYSIGHAYDTIRFGRAEIMIAGGTDPFSRVAFTGFARLGSVAPELCQPFDKGRRGIMVGEGAAILVLERLDRALDRNAPILAEMLGHGISCDAHHMTAPDPEGEGISRAMKSALKHSGVAPEEVGYINAHGTGTPVNDKVETRAIKKVFGKYAYELCVSSTKSMTGHTMGAASALEAIACILALKEGVVPPTINYETPDEECDLDYVPNSSRKTDIHIAINNGIAFGGNNSCTVFSRYEG